MGEFMGRRIKDDELFTPKERMIIENELRDLNQFLEGVNLSREELEDFLIRYLGSYWNTLKKGRKKYLN